MWTVRPLALVSLFLATAYAHGDHGASKKPAVGDDADWLTRHMAEEHHIASFDASSAFTLHDFDGDGFWAPIEIERTYGLHHVDGDGDGVDAAAPGTADDNDKRALRAAVVARVLGLFDANGDGRVSRAEWRNGYEAQGKTLPDMGTGPGHHGDDEYEYEIHHWEKYHDENTKLEDLTHPEDIAHFEHHERLEREEAEREAAAAARDSLPIALDNVPAMFRRPI